MPNKSYLKSTEPLEATKVEKLDKNSSEVEKQSTVIDDIFATRKRKKLEQRKSENFARTKPEVQKSGSGNEEGTMNPESMDGIKKKKKNKKSMEDEEGRFIDKPARHRKKINSGLKIYTEEELGINNPDAGNTPDCPFDCDCCF